MRFTKMHGAGNDYIYVDCLKRPQPEDPSRLAKRVSDRHFGIGGDGLVLICPSEIADARMRMFNSDGSESEMCGNALRCMGKYLFDRGLRTNKTLRIETAAGVVTLDLDVADGRVRQVRVDMGVPILQPDLIPTTLPGNSSPRGGAVVDAELRLGAEKLQVTCVSMGNPHCVTFVDEVTDHWVLDIGPRIENDPHFPNRTNAEFAQVISPTEVRMRVWERGTGETLACGSGACAVCVAGALSGRTGRKVLVRLPGGDLELHWADDEHVYLTGPAVEVFNAELTTDNGLERMPSPSGTVPKAGLGPVLG
ncbi:MAG: diaminopimelate epimerase [Planctomycetes bacterium RBG_13_63_9]|nr:MAG: diaminopimelate epimerase [Planctomycetes bacterium RBG_13_63_9]